LDITRGYVTGISKGSLRKQCDNWIWRPWARKLFYRQRHKRKADPRYVDYDQSVQLYRDEKANQPPRLKAWKTNYQITGRDRDANIGKESVHQTHKGSNEFLVAIGKQVYPEFLVFVSKGCLMVLGWASLC
jgi:hypothetical protein